MIPSSTCFLFLGNQQHIYFEFNCILDFHRGILLTVAGSGDEQPAKPQRAPIIEFEQDARTASDMTSLPLLVGVEKQLNPLTATRGKHLVTTFSGFLLKSQ